MELRAVLSALLVLAGSSTIVFGQSTVPTAARTPAPAIHLYDDDGRPNPDAFDWTGIAVGANIGTLGYGANASIYLTPWLNFRATAAFLPFDYDDEIDDIDFDLEVDFNTARFLLDFYPAGNSTFRISVGLVYADNVIDIKGTPQESETIGDNTYTPEQIGTISGSMTFDDWSPYIGIGFGNPVRPDTAFSVSMDLGVMFQSYETTISASGNAAGSPVFEDDLAELKNDIDDALDNFKIYPVITVSVSYHF